MTMVVVGLLRRHLRLIEGLRVLLPALLPLLILDNGGVSHAAPAQQPDEWVVDQIYVYSSGMQQPVQGEERGLGERTFVWNGELLIENVDVFKGQGILRLEFPDRIAGGSQFTFGARVDGTVSITNPPFGQDDRGNLSLNGGCQGDVKYGSDERILTPGTYEQDLTAALETRTFTIPSAQSGFGYGCGVDATIGGRVGSDMDWWRIQVNISYAPVSTAPSPRLVLEASLPRIPPSGGRPSTSDLTATLTGADGRGLAGQRVELRLDPADMGRLNRSSGDTDGNGVLQARYMAPTQAETRGRDRVVVSARNPAFDLEQWVTLNIEGYSLSLTVDPTELPVQPSAPSARVRVVAATFDGRPAAGDEIQFRLDPPDLGSLIGIGLNGDRAVTDAQGVIELLYEPPEPSQLRGRDRVSIHATNVSHQGEASAGIVFRGLRVIRTAPGQNERDVDLQPGDTIDFEFDRPIDRTSVNAQTLVLSTLWHGQLNPAVEAFGQTASLRVQQDPIPDVGLEVRARLVGGDHGVRGRDGSVLISDHVLTFKTLPRLQPRLIVSQVVDDPRDGVYGVISLAPKPFALRVEVGLSPDSELTEERVVVNLVDIASGETTSMEHTFYPGQWPPDVPSEAVKRGNSANFIVRDLPAAGGHTYRADVRGAAAPQDLTVIGEPVTINLNRWAGARQASGIGIQAVPIFNDQIPQSAWPGARPGLEPWATNVGTDAGDYLPQHRLNISPGTFANTNCGDGVECHWARDPTSHFRYWVRQLGRAGFFTQWSYVVGVVPPNWFDALDTNPIVADNPTVYNETVVNGVWTDAWVRPSDKARFPFPVALVEAGLPAAHLVHVLGDVTGLSHLPNTGNPDVLRGYDLRRDRVIRTDGGRWTGASLSVMNELMGGSYSWMTRADYEHFLNRWTERSCVGPPPCPPAQSMQFGAEAGTHSAQNDQSPQALVAVTGLLLRAGGNVTAALDPLLRFDGVPSLPPAGGLDDYALVLRDAGGAELARYTFESPFEAGSADATASFLWTVPRPDALTSVAIVRGSATFAERKRSASAPTVAFVRPAPGAVHRGDIDVAWTAQDADGDPLTFFLALSGDGGATWLPLVIDGTATSYRLRGNDVPNGSDVRLRLVAGDGFDNTEATLSFALDAPPAVSATDPEDGERGVSPYDSVVAAFRDPLDPASVHPGSFFVRDVSGVLVGGSVEYEALNNTVVFTPDAPLVGAHSYQARLTSSMRRLDGRALAADFVWQFTVRGREVYLPWMMRSGGATSPAASRTPTPLPPIMTSTATPTRTPPTVTPTNTTLPSPSGTLVPPSPTATTPAAPATATPPTATPPTATPTSTVPGVTALLATTTGASQDLLRMAFGPGETIKFWLQVDNSTGGSATVDVEFLAVSDSGSAPPELAWQGSLEIPAGIEWLSLERTVPTTAPAGPYTFVGQVAYASQPSAGTSAFYLGDVLLRADDFSDPASGWSTVDEPAALSRYLDGAFQILFRADDLARMDTPGVTATFYAFEADTQLVAGSGAVGLAAELSADATSWLVFAVTGDRRYGLFRRVGGGWQPLVPYTASTVLQPTGSINRLLLARQGSELQLFANGRRLTTVTDNVTPGGRTGVYAEGSTGTDARFDNFRVYELR